jgi:isopenicillin-N N-acyltransferase-like protein
MRTPTLPETSFVKLRPARQGLMKDTRFAIVEVEGPPFEMGYQHGSKFKRLIALSLETFRRMLISGTYGTLPAGMSGPSLEQALDFACQAIPLSAEYAPEVIQEMHGIAEGSGFKFEEIFALSAKRDILRTVGSQGGWVGSAGDCSSYAVTSGATVDGETYVGWNADTDEDWLSCAVIIKGRPAEGPPLMF